VPPNWALQLREGDGVDVRRLGGASWFDCRVRSVAGGRAFVHYVGWSDGWDEWIALGSERLAPHRSRARPGPPEEAVAPPAREDNKEEARQAQEPVPQARPRQQLRDGARMPDFGRGGGENELVLELLQQLEVHEREAAQLRQRVAELEREAQQTAALRRRVAQLEAECERLRPRQVADAARRALASHPERWSREEALAWLAHVREEGGFAFEPARVAMPGRLLLRATRESLSVELGKPLVADVVLGELRALCEQHAEAPPMLPPPPPYSEQ
jgi:hypothetical protein